MRIMFSHLDEAVRSVAVHVEGLSSPIYLGPIDDPKLLSSLAEGGEEAIARDLLAEHKWMTTFSNLVGVELTAAERALFSYQSSAPQNSRTSQHRTTS